jgi:O-succinylbenzoate synthase
MSGPRWLSTQWAEVGQSHSVVVRAVELTMVEIPFLTAVSTSRGVHSHRRLALVRIVAETGGRIIEGWGECAALSDTTYDGEDAGAAFRALESSLVPQMIDQCARDGGQLATPTRLGPAGPNSGPLAYAALEMAVGDTHLQAEGRSFADLLGVAGRSVEPGAVVGLSASIEALVSKVGELADAGFTRVKMKIAPGRDLAPVAAVRAAAPAMGLQVDANESYGPDDYDHLAQLDEFGLLCLEQPFDREDLDAHARLAARMDTPICLDESLTSPARVSEALRQKACSVVCVKPSRLGGIESALRVIEDCAASGVPLWMGGMFESGYARGVNVALAALPGFAWPGDLSAARTYLADDLLGVRSAGKSSGPGLAIPVPAGDGFGLHPDREAVLRLSSSAVRWDLSDR